MQVAEPPPAVYENAFVLTALTRLVLNKLKASATKSSRNLSWKVNPRPTRKSTLVRLGRVDGLRGNQEARPPVGLAKVLISAPVMPPSPWRGFKTVEPLGFGVIFEVLIFAAYGWPVPELTMEDTVQPSTSRRAIALERFFP